MVLEEELLPYLNWLTGYPWTDARSVLGSALAIFLMTAFAATVVALIGGFLIALVRHGPMKAGDMTYRVVTGGVAELFRTSPRRVWAIARLAVKESWRRRVWVTLVVYVVILLFAGWFLKTDYREPGKLFFSVVLMATTYLTLLIALLISAFSLPQDFKSKTIYTVVTKPVRAGDIVLGRILGFTLIGTALLAVMAMFSALFVWRMLNHTHGIDVANLQNDYDAKRNPIGKSGRTSLSQSHRHEVIINSDGSGRALSTNEHEHAISARQVGSETVYEVSDPEGMFRARVPEYGKLRFLDRKGVPVAKGVNVGNEWQYRSFVDGGTQAAAIWTFGGVNASHLRTEEDEDGQVRQVLPLELIVRVFRTYKGNVETGIQGSMQLRNPETQLKSDLWTFTAKDASINTFNWPLKLDDENRNAVDLIDDMVSKDGRLEVIVQCIDNAQYFGFAMPDCFIRLPDGSPLWNYIKAQVSIWVQMVLVIAIGVTCSTVVNGPVAMIFTASYITLGFFWQMFFDVATGKQIGGGPLESLYRIVTHMNQMSPLPENFGTQMIVAVDTVLRAGMFSLAHLLPNFSKFSTVDYIAYGFYIPINRLAQELTACLAFLAGLFVAGYFLLRTREVAK
jgi:hypothetical protein